MPRRTWSPNPDDAPPPGYHYVTRPYRVLPDGSRDYAAYHGKTEFKTIAPDGAPAQPALRRPRLVQKGSVQTMTSARPELKWDQMEPAQKLAWWGKFLIAVLTLGFAFPRVMEPRLRDDRP